MLLKQYCVWVFINYIFYVKSVIILGELLCYDNKFHIFLCEYVYLKHNIDM